MWCCEQLLHHTPPVRSSATLARASAAAHLHARDLGVDDAQPAAAQAQHGVGLAQGLQLGLNRGSVNAQLGRQLVAQAAHRRAARAASRHIVSSLGEREGAGFRCQQTKTMQAAACICDHNSSRAPSKQSEKGPPAAQH